MGGGGYIQTAVVTARCIACAGYLDEYGRKVGIAKPSSPRTCHSLEKREFLVMNRSEWAYVRIGELVRDGNRGGLAGAGVVFVVDCTVLCGLTSLVEGRWWSRAGVRDLLGGWGMWDRWDGYLVFIGSVLC